MQYLVYTNQKRLIHLFTIQVCLEGVILGFIQDIWVYASLSQHDQGRHLDLSTADMQLVVEDVCPDSRAVFCLVPTVCLAVCTASSLSFMSMSFTEKPLVISACTINGAGKLMDLKLFTLLKG